MEKQYKYDVAFSFLAEDEELVYRLNDLFEDRLNTFVYSAKQKELAGTDGMESFSKVFAEESRVVVVFLREQWGRTKWTGIEETAIRKRAFEEQFDFTIFVPLDPDPKIPAWLPPNRLWYSLKRYGLECLAAAIESRVQEQGGRITEITALDYATRVARDIQVDKERMEFLKSSAGFQSALNEVAVLGSELESLVQNMDVKVAHIHKSMYKISVSSYKGSITFDWRVNCGNMVNDAILFVDVFDAFVSYDAGRRMTFHEPNKVNSYKFEFTYELRPEKVCGWRMKSESKRFFTSKELADYCVRLLLKTIHTMSIEERN